MLVCNLCHLTYIDSSIINVINNNLINVFNNKN